MQRIKYKVTWILALNYFKTHIYKQVSQANLSSGWVVVEPVRWVG